MSAMAMFLLGLLFLLLGGDSLLKGTAGLAQRFGLSPFAAGLLLVAFGTSIPELVVNSYALAAGASELALGNAIGSNIVNIGLTLGVAALVAPLLVSMRLVAAQVVFVLVASGLVLAFGLDGEIARWEGAILLAGFAGFLVFAFTRGRQEAPEVQAELAGFAATSSSLVQNLIRFAIAVALLAFGSKWVVQGAPALGLALGLGTMVTGLTLVAIGTALPEIVVAALAAYNGQGNVVAGHVLGACLFNLLFVVGGMAVLQPLPLPASFVTLELPAAMAFALLLYPILGGDLRVGRREGAVLVLAFLAWLAFELYTTLH
ncbi:MAG: sodium:calcium antiporter [Arenimonas sp.]